MLTTLEILAMITGAGYAILAARRNRLCWVSGAISSCLAAVVAGLRGLPMHSGLQVFFVGMAVYGWVSWTRNRATGGLLVGWWQPWRHVVAAAIIVPISIFIARLLAARTEAAWPLLDTLTTGFSLLATWLAARACLENWLYWIVIDGVLVFLFYKQDSPYLALLNLLFMGIATAGYIAWHRRLRAQTVPP